MDTIKNYLDSLFVNVEPTEETIQLKNDLLAHMEDRYHELLEEGKNEHEAIGAVISEFGSIDELLEEIDLKKAEGENEEPFVEEAYQAAYADDSRETMELSDFHNYVRERKKAAVMIGTGVFAVLMSVFSEIFFNGPVYISGVGNALFFLFVAIAVGLFIYGGMTFSRAKRQLNDLFITREVRQAAQGEQEGFARSFTFCIILGVMACILSVAPAALTYSSTYSSSVGEALMFPIIGCGVFLFIYGGVVKATFSQFLSKDIFVDEENIGPNALLRSRDKDYYQKKRWFAKIFWPIVVAFYFLFSFTTGSWAMSWIIFVIAGIFEDSFESFFKNRNVRH